MSSAAEYWAERNRMVMTQGLEKADAVARELEKSYRRAQREVQAAVDKIYATFAGESGLSYADAQAYLTKGELKEWRYTLEEYVERINASGDKDLLRELNALSARSRIRRLQQVQTAIDVAASELASRGEALTRDLLEDAYGGAYVQVGGALQAGLGVGGRLEMLNRTEVAQAAAYPWSGASFSERIWNNADSLARALRQAVTQGLIQGQDVRQMSAAIAKATGSSAADAERLIRTETARCIEEATLKGYAAAGIAQYQILVDEDERTCKFCGAIDEEAVHEVAGAVTGVNLPPFHPRCRCTTVPYFSEEELDRWEALGAAASGDSLAYLTEDGILEETREDIRAGRYPRKLQKNRQMRHIPGNEAYDRYAAQYAAKNEYGPSRVTIGLEKIQELIERYAGTGVLKMDRNGQWTHTEIILDNEEVIGVAVNNRTGAEAPTTVFKIHYASDGAHLVPDYPSKKRRRET